MANINKFEECVYKAIVELTNISPDGELTYTKILTCYLNGQANKSIPWEAIQKSIIYGKFPKVNLFTVMMACNKLTELGYLKKIKVDNNYKYFLTNVKSIDHIENKSFLEKIGKYKRYLVNLFADYLIKICPSLKSVEHENYYGFINKNPVYLNEYNWIWIADETSDANSLKVFVRYRPNLKAIAYTLTLSQNSFFDVVDEIIDVLRDEKNKYNLIINTNIERPIIDSPSLSKKSIEKDLKKTPIDFSPFLENADVFLNDGSDESINAALTTSESSPYKYSGDTIFSPKELNRMAQGKNTFDFSFVKWKVALWTVLANDKTFIQNVILVSKKTKNTWVVVSIPKRKVVCLTTNCFEILIGNKKYNSDEIINALFEKQKPNSN